jgi:hypothetical protein
MAPIARDRVKRMPGTEPCLRRRAGQGVSPRCQPLGNESTEASAMPRHDLVQRVQQRRRSHGSQDSAERAGQPDRDEERHGPAGIPGKQAPVGKDEPPALAARLLGHGREQMAGFLVGQREQRQLFVPVDRGDDPRRPPTEPSAP